MIKKFYKTFTTFSILCFIMITSCKSGSDLYDEFNKSKMGNKIDSKLGLSYQDYEDTLFPKKAKEEKKEIPTIPKSLNLLATPEAPVDNLDTLVSVSATEDIPLKDVLIELSRLASLNIEIDPNITGGIIFQVKNKPVSYVIDRISKLANLRYSYQDGIVRIEKDTPYLLDYMVDYLNIVRSGSGNVSINTQVLGGNSGSTGGEGINSGSSNSIEVSYEGDLWKSVEQTITDILTHEDSSLSANNSDNEKVDAKVDINKQAGVISIYANEKKQALIRKYLDDVSKSVSAQVLIEAKVIEVTLSEEYKTGVNWSSILEKDIGPDFEISFGGGIDTTGNFFSIGNISDISTAVTMTEAFGTTRTLSSPRLHAMNNQQAVLTFAENKVYFTIEVEEESNTSSSGTAEEKNLTVESTLNTVPIGVILTLQPSINVETNEVTMSIRPTLSRITGEVLDPGVQLIVERNKGTSSSVDIKSAIPIIEVRELDTILKAKSGSIMVIGGLMQEVSANQDKGIPYLEKIPLFGNLVKSKNKSVDVVETIIFIKPTIVASNKSSYSNSDKKVYNTFSRDPSPLSF